MTKSELIEALEHLPDDTVIRIRCTCCETDLIAHGVEDVNDGSDGTEPELTIVGV